MRYLGKGRLLVDQRLAVFANAHSFSVFLTLHAYAGWLTALGANYHHVGEMDRTLKLDDPGRQIAAALGLHLALMLFTHIHTLHHYTAIFR
jgi:hypothetical protein